MKPPHLSLGKEVCHEGALDGIVHVAIVEDDEGAFPPQLQHGLL